MTSAITTSSDIFHCSHFHQCKLWYLSIKRRYTHRTSSSNLVVVKYWDMQSDIFHVCPWIMLTPASHKGAISTISNHRFQRLLQSTWIESRTLQNGNCTLQLPFREGDKKKPRFFMTKSSIKKFQNVSYKSLFWVLNIRLLGTFWDLNKPGMTGFTELGLSPK